MVTLRAVVLTADLVAFFTESPRIEPELLFFVVEVPFFVEELLFFVVEVLFLVVPPPIFFAILVPALRAKLVAAAAIMVPRMVLPMPPFLELLFLDCFSFSLACLSFSFSAALSSFSFSSSAFWYASVSTS